MKNNQRKKSLRFHPFSALFGYTVYSVKKEHLEDTLTLCSRLRPNTATGLRPAVHS